MKMRIWAKAAPKAHRKAAQETTVRTQARAAPKAHLKAAQEMTVKTLARAAQKAPRKVAQETRTRAVLKTLRVRTVPKTLRARRRSRKEKVGWDLVKMKTLAREAPRAVTLAVTMMTAVMDHQKVRLFCYSCRVVTFISMSLD